MRKFDITTFLFSLIAAIIACVAGEALIFYLYNQISNILLVGLYFVITGLIIVSITCFCVYKVSKLKFEIPVSNIFLKSMTTLVALTIVLSFAFGSLFEFLYEMGFSKNKVTNNYIVVIDNSGSMQTNDPYYERFDALNELFNSIKKNQKMGVYVFNDESINVLPIQNIDKNKFDEYEATLDKYKVSEGGTNLMLALEDIMNYIDIQNITGNSSAIVISDGECNIDASTINKFISANIPIHTIGVANGYASLHNVSEQTGGTYYDIKDTKTLRQTFTTIYNLNNNNMLLTERTGKSETAILYILMRIAFITILAIIIKIMQLFIVDIKDLRSILAVECIAFSIISGFCLELLMQHTTLDERVIRLIMLVFISLIFVGYLNKSKSSKNSILDPESYNLINSRLVGNKSSSIKSDEKRKSLK